MCSTTTLVAIALLMSRCTAVAAAAAAAAAAGWQRACVFKTTCEQLSDVGVCGCGRCWRVSAHARIRVRWTERASISCSTCTIHSSIHTLAHTHTKAPTYARLSTHANIYDNAHSQSVICPDRTHNFRRRALMSSNEIPENVIIELNLNL